MTNADYFKPCSSLTFATVAADKVRLITLLKSSQPKALHCDLSEVELCDSAGLALLIDIRRLCRQHAVVLTIEHIPDDVRALANLYGVELILYMSPEEIEALFNTQPDVVYAKVTSDGKHYELTVVSDRFVALPKVKRQQWVYGLLNQSIVSGRIHAVQMHTLTKDEWEKQNG